MNSPDPDSLSESSSSGTPPPEETSPYVPAAGTGNSYLSSLTNHLTATFAGGASSSPSKRRLPTGASFAAASSARDPKSRRRERGGQHNTWEKEHGGPGKKEPKDDLLDQGLVEHLRKGMSISLWHVPFNIDT
jgi:hypothetical protein